MIEKSRKRNNVSADYIYQQTLGFLMASGHQPPMVRFTPSYLDSLKGVAYEHIVHILRPFELVQIPTIPRTFKEGSESYDKAAGLEQPSYSSTRRLLERNSTLESSPHW